jgi:hypothetical protein
MALFVLLTTRYVMQFKSVGVDINTYNKIKQISEDEHRNIRQQLAKLVDECYVKKYGEKKNGGLGLVSSS